MKIDANVRPNQTGSVSETQLRGTKTGATGSTPGANVGGPRVEGPLIELSTLGSQLAGIEATLADVPVVDTRRVEEIKLAMSEGRFTVHPEVIADKLLQTVQELIRAQKG